MEATAEPQHDRRSTPAPATMLSRAETAPPAHPAPAPVPVSVIDAVFPLPSSRDSPFSA